MSSLHFKEYEFCVEELHFVSRSQGGRAGQGKALLRIRYRSTSSFYFLFLFLNTPTTRSSKCSIKVSFITLHMSFSSPFPRDNLCGVFYVCEYGWIVLKVQQGSLDGISINPLFPSFFTFFIQCRSDVSFCVSEICASYILPRLLHWPLSISNA